MRGGGGHSGRSRNITPLSNYPLKLEYFCIDQRVYYNLTPLSALYGEMDWLKTKYRHYIHVIRFWNRFVNMIKKTYFSV